MRLLVNHQLIQIAMQSKSISLEQISYKRSQGIAITSLHSSFFDVKKQRSTTNPENSYQCSVSIEISLDRKVYISLVTY